jgi:hypothetical protein
MAIKKRLFVARYLGVGFSNNAERLFESAEECALIFSTSKGLKPEQWAELANQHKKPIDRSRKWYADICLKKAKKDLEEGFLGMQKLFEQKRRAQRGLKRKNSAEAKSKLKLIHSQITYDSDLLEQYRRLKAEEIFFAAILNFEKGADEGSKI